MKKLSLQKKSMAQSSPGCGESSWRNLAQYRSNCSELNTTLWAGCRHFSLIVTSFDVQVYGNNTVIFSKLGFLKCSCLSTISKITKEKEKCSWKVNVDKKNLSSKSSSCQNWIPIYTSRLLLTRKLSVARFLEDVAGPSRIWWSIKLWIVSELCCWTMNAVAVVWLDATEQPSRQAMLTGSEEDYWAVGISCWLQSVVTEPSRHFPDSMDVAELLKMAVDAALRQWPFGTNRGLFRTLLN